MDAWVTVMQVASIATNIIGFVEILVAEHELLLDVPIADGVDKGMFQPGFGHSLACQNYTGTSGQEGVHFSG